MALNLFKAFLFVAGGAVAAAGTAYIGGALDPYIHGRAGAVALPGGGDLKSNRLAKPDPGSSHKPATTETRKATEPSPAAGQPAKPPVVPPSFDVVRVEPDGSLVVAGEAGPGAKVEIATGTKVLGNATAGEDGDFAIVLDEPLGPGDYQLVLRSTARDNVVATSTETAVVSIPDKKNGQVLALVEKPGKPSKLITVPEPKAAGTEPNSPAKEMSPPDAAAKQPVEPKVPAPVASESASTQFSPPKAPAPETSESASTQPSPPNALPQTGENTSGQEIPGDGPNVAVDAVEIEGRGVFVAGVADPGRKVRVYANDILLGEAEASPDGRFLIETERDLPVGDYIIRADALEPNGDKVVARAAVPFEREPGVSVAAVAPETANQAAKPGETLPVPGASAAPPSPDVGTSPGSKEQGVAAASPEPGKEGAGEASQVTAPKLQSVDGAVIIRRGDTLWRISRRVYGRGIRYSTIYLANQDQIRNPNRIWPGQVFAVPNKTTEGEEADMSAVKEQTTAMPSKPQM
jgi:nucleoid-associated protein YgaU